MTHLAVFFSVFKHDHTFLSNSSLTVFRKHVYKVLISDLFGSILAVFESCKRPTIIIHKHFSGTCMLSGLGSRWCRLLNSVTPCWPSLRPRWRCCWQCWVSASVWAEVEMERTGTARLLTGRRCWRWAVCGSWCTGSWPAAPIRDRWRSALCWRATSNCSTRTPSPQRRSKVGHRRPARGTGRVDLWRYRWTCSVSRSVTRVVFTNLDRFSLLNPVLRFTQKPFRTCLSAATAPFCRPSSSTVTALSIWPDSCRTVRWAPLQTLHFMTIMHLGLFSSESK